MILEIPMFPKRLPEAKPRAGLVEQEQYAFLASKAKELWLGTFLARIQFRSSKRRVAVPTEARCRHAQRLAHD